MRIALNRFVMRYAKIYQTSVVQDDLLFIEHRNEIRSILESRYKPIMEMASKYAYQDIIKDVEKSILINMTSLLVAEYVRQYALKKAIGIASVSLAKIRNRIDNGIKEGLPIIEIASLIRGIVAINPNRAETIARTETHAAANYGSIKTAKNAQAEFGIIMQKEWVATNDARTRDTHAQMDGVIVDVDENFNVNGYMTDRPNGEGLPAEESINCRCVMTYRKKEFSIE